ncbi:MAG: WecB/TagA/CpsF family glycosyltransferase [Armatimonadota bacterium]|nr:WecB/TagA/CpsF family glycosyltransferase [Armatimonadota bacterium]
MRLDFIRQGRIGMEAELRSRQTNAQPEKKPERVDILGVGVDRVSMDDAIRRVRGFLSGNGPRMIVTADSAGVMITRKDPELLSIVRAADLVTPDSSGILMAAKLLGTPLIERVSGIDLAQEICRLCADVGLSIFFLGAAPGVAEAAAVNLTGKFPGLRIAGTHDGFFTDDTPVVEEIRRSGAAALFVAMGIPKQEKWIAAHLGELGVLVAIGIGGSFDVFSGNVRRAPAWMRNHGLEWLHRLISNPRKISKVAHLPRFALMALRERLISRKGREG